MNTKKDVRSRRHRDEDVPDVEEERKPDDPTDLDARSWKFVARKTLHEFSADGCTDIAAALTYYAVLALFPALIALMSLVGVVGQGRQSADTVLQILRDVGAGGAAETLEPTLTQLSQSSGAGLALIVGLLAALWSASGYVGAFSRAMNRMYEVGEGRPIWKLRPLLLLVTAVMVMLAALVLVALVLTGPAAEAVGSAMGIGGPVVTVWAIVKWPVILVVVILIVALLYYSTPNVEQPKFRWISVGAVFAIFVWVVVSLAFGFYVANFSSYNKTYGALAGVVVFLLWLWLTNLALLFGAELDSELERGRELQAGIEAEDRLQLPLRDTTKLDKDAEKDAELLAAGREIRTEPTLSEHGRRAGARAHDGRVAGD
ncbi:YihY/virulence factor BrkB family protein [soil metagenome]